MQDLDNAALTDERINPEEGLLLSNIYIAQEIMEKLLQSEHQVPLLMLSLSNKDLYLRVGKFLHPSAVKYLNDKRIHSRWSARSQLIEGEVLKSGIRRCFADGTNRSIAWLLEHFRLSDFEFRGLDLDLAGCEHPSRGIPAMEFCVKYPLIAKTEDFGRDLIMSLLDNTDYYGKAVCTLDMVMKAYDQFSWREHWNGKYWINAWTHCDAKGYEPALKLTSDMIHTKAIENGLVDVIIWLNTRVPRHYYWLMDVLTSLDDSSNELWTNLVKYFHPPMMDWMVKFVFDPNSLLIQTGRVHPRKLGAHIFRGMGLNIIKFNSDACIEWLMRDDIPIRAQYLRDFSEAVILALMNMERKTVTQTDANQQPIPISAGTKFVWYFLKQLLPNPKDKLLNMRLNKNDLEAIASLLTPEMQTWITQNSIVVFHPYV